MDFKGLVLNVLNESPDSIIFNNKEYHYDLMTGRPITFVIGELLFVDDYMDNWDEEQDKPKSYDGGLGEVIVYGLPYKNEPWSHTDLLEQLSGLSHPYNEQWKFNVRFFSPQFDVEGFLNKKSEKSPKFAVYVNGNVETLPANRTGRMWKIKENVVVSLWDDDEKTMEQFVIPLVKQIYPKVSEKNIMIEDQMTDTFYPSSKLGIEPKKEKEPYQKELADLQRQLHLASGDSKKRNEIIKKIVEICNKHGIDPKKYGISDEVLKSSQIYAQKVGGTSSEPIASIKQKLQTSESLLNSFYGKALE